MKTVTQARSALGRGHVKAVRGIRWWQFYAHWSGLLHSQMVNIHIFFQCCVPSGPYSHLNIKPKHITCNFCHIYHGQLISRSEFRGSSWTSTSLLNESLSLQTWADCPFLPPAIFLKSWMPKGRACTLSFSTTYCLLSPPYSFTSLSDSWRHLGFWSLL